MKARSFLPALALLCAAGFSTALAQTSGAAETKLEIGTVFARGDYGLSADTDVFMVNVTPTWETDSLRLQATLPYLRLKGPATVVGNTGPVVTSRSSSGIGDASLSLTGKFAPEKGWSTELTGKVKFPTANEAKGLGTGETDYSVQIDVFHTGGPITPYATLGYQFLGSNATYAMKDGFFAGAGLAGQVAAGTTAGAGVNWRQEFIAGGDEGVEAMLFVQRKLSETTLVRAFVMRGFTDASPDIAGGVAFGFTF